MEDFVQNVQSKFFKKQDIAHSVEKYYSVVIQEVQQVLEIKNYKNNIKKVTTAWEMEFQSQSDSEAEEPNIADGGRSEQLERGADDNFSHISPEP